jgi:hypothetical protein
MKPFKFGLRIWITVSSLLIFLTSWIMFGHSPKPISSPQAYIAPLPTLAPLPPMSGSVNTQQRNSGFSFFSLFNNRPRSRSTFVTRGS